MNSAIASLLNGVSAVAIGGYLAAVVIQGNADEFISEAISDWHYVEFLLALIAIKAALDLPYIGEAVFWFVAMAATATALKVVSDNDAFNALKEYGNGKASMFETVMRIFS